MNIGGIEIKNWNIENVCGYKPITTCYLDLEIVKKFTPPTETIKELDKTIGGLWNAMRGNIEHITELVMAINWHSWASDNSNELQKYFVDKYYEMVDKVFEEYGDNEQAIQYYLRTTD